MSYRYDAERIRRCYDLTASEYARRFRRELEEKHFDRVILPWFASQIPTGQLVLDLGMGHGHTTAFLAALGVGIQGVDLSEAMVAEARAAYPSVVFRGGDMRRLDQAEQSVAGLLAYYSIVHFDLESLAQFFAEAYRVLRREGVLLFTFHVRENEELVSTDSFLEVQGASADWVLFDVATVVALVKQAGLRVLDVLQREPYEPSIEFPSRRCYVIVRK